MNDHNLDDLIIDNIEPKSSKAKSALTIIALLIVVLIVAIILTSVVLDDPKSNDPAAQDNETEMVSPELTLANIGKVKKPQAEPKLNDIIEEELNKPVNAKKTAVTIDKPEVKVLEEKKVVAKEIVEEIPLPKVKTPEIPETKVVEAAPVKENKKVEITKEFEQTQNKAPVIPVAEKVTPAVPAVASKPAKKPAPVASGSYYIQVGAYKNAPSQQLLRSIKNGGFSYKLTSGSSIKKLLIGPYTNRESANNALVRVKDLINKSAFVKQY